MIITEIKSKFEEIYKEFVAQSEEKPFPRTIEDPIFRPSSDGADGGQFPLKALIINVLFYFERASCFYFMGDAYLFYKYFNECLFNALGLYAIKINKSDWAEPYCLLKGLDDELEKKYIMGIFPPVMVEHANPYRQRFIDWFEFLIEELDETLDLENYPGESFGPEKISKFLWSIYDRDYLVNFRRVKGVKNIYRSPNPANFTDRFEILENFFKENNITDVIDLRGPNEASEKSLSQKEREKLGVRVHVLDFNEPQVHMPGTGSYVKKLILLKDVIKRSFEIVLEAKGWVLIHCAAGKDRTGVLAAIFQKLAGVEDDIIIDDYTRTGWDARPDRIKEVLDYLESAGGIESYLDKCNVDKELRRKVFLKIKKEM